MKLSKPANNVGKAIKAQKQGSETTLNLYKNTGSLAQGKLLRLQAELPSQWGEHNNNVQVDSWNPHDALSGSSKTLEHPITGQLRKYLPWRPDP